MQMQNENCRLRVTGRPGIKCTHCHFDFWETSLFKLSCCLYNKHKGLCYNRDNMFMLKLELLTHSTVHREMWQKKGVPQIISRAKCFTDFSYVLLNETSSLPHQQGFHLHYSSSYPGFQRIFFSYRYYLRLVNAALLRTISVNKKEISSGTQGI